ncbi:MAG: efflux RND transporter periplasmic adaptor subunit, partial [Chloroflexi bacterium]|nr:efflux RND transporter periplasmic adaptor subunit [Chloroflexota bacterium]
ASPEPRPTLDRRVEQVVTADGELRFPEAPQPASFSTAGRLIALDVEVDDEVYPGQVLARIDDTGLQQAVAEARAALIAARSQLAELERGGELERARLQLEQAKNNRWGSQAIRDATCGREKPFFDQASCDQADANVNAAEQSVQLAELAYQTLQQNRETDLAAARARLASAELGLRRAETSLAGASLTAPITATVTERNGVPGIDVAPGTPLLMLVRTRPLSFVTSNLGERFVGAIRPGDPAKVTLTAYPDRELAASVDRIEVQGARDPSGAVVFTVHLDMAAVEDLALYAGMTGRVEIQVGGDEGG